MEKTLTVANYKCNAIINIGEGVPVVFLHGMSYSREVWKSIGALDILKKKNVPFLAMDMPYGPKTGCQPKTHSVEANIAVTRAAVLSTFGSIAPVLVGASLGGHISLVYASQFPVRGLLLVSPTRVFHEALVQAYSSFTFPVRLIWGSEDNIVSGEDLRNLAAKLPNAKLVTYEGAGHSAYRNHPDRFKRDLLEFYAVAEQR